LIEKEKRKSDAPSLSLQRSLAISELYAYSLINAIPMILPQAPTRGQAISTS
jgi:hypothetical protein